MDDPNYVGHPDCFNFLFHFVESSIDGKNNKKQIDHTWQPFNSDYVAF